MANDAPRLGRPAETIGMFSPSRGSGRRIGWMTILAAACLPAAAGERLSFNRDIRPIMSDTCFHCHGNDAGTREAGLRLDVREAAVGETESGLVPIVPGDPDSSGIIQRIFDAADPMPPESAHKPLSDEQKALLRRWVAEGAEYEPHWAYAALNRPPVPGEAGLHPIDAFLRARLDQAGLAPAPEADPHQLERRLCLDLTGLPPEAALPPASRPAPADLVDTLLASPHFGERMAVWWLDIARYADTVGFHGDQNQRIFPYRDYVIDAFNRNKPFDEFTREQLAGDLLPNPTPEQLVATGYNRLNMMTREGGAQPREYLAKYGAERVRSVAAAWFGSTFGCAECHDHKFDPITARDFYELQAFFADVKQYGVYGSYPYSPEPDLEGFDNDHPFPPEIEVESPWLKRRHDEVRERLQRLTDAAVRRAGEDPATRTAQAAWETALAPVLESPADGWLRLAPAKATVVKSGKPVEDRRPVIGDEGGVSTTEPLRDGEHLRLVAPAALPWLAAIRLTIPTAGLTDAQRSLLAGSQRTLTVFAQAPGNKPRPIPLLAGDAGVRRPVYRSGVEQPGLSPEWRLPFDLPAGDELEAIWIVDPTRLEPDERVVVRITGESRLPMRLAISPLGGLEPLEVASPAELASLRVPAADRTPADSARATGGFLLATAHDRAAFSEAHALAAAARGLSGGRARTLVTESIPDPLTVRVLPRGNWLDESGPVVLPATPSFLPGRITSRPGHRLTRLDLANWLVSDANPITSRAVMNRLWALFFGVGLSAAVDDLGSQGELPSHPELLDWLACEFRDSGWDFKHMIRLIVTSHAYRQSSDAEPGSLAVDPGNRLLATQNPRRLEAEFVRDNALAIAGLLVLDEVGGPSVRPYQPAGYYEPLQFPNREYVADTDPRQWRRGLYTHWQRTFLHPMLANFDAPARDECAAARTLSNTPQQALTLLNDPIFVEAARVLAARLLGAEAADQDRIRRGFRLALNREPRPEETSGLVRFLASQREAFAAAPDDAAKLVAVGLAPQAGLDPVEHAAWTQLARVLLNTQEVITRY